MSWWKLAACLLLAWLARADSRLPCKSFAVANKDAEVNEWDISKVTIDYGNESDYKLLRRLGRGSFGEAYLGWHTQSSTNVVIKIFLPTKMAINKMVREIFLLQTVCGGPNIMRLLDVIREESGLPALVLEHIRSDHSEVDQLYSSLSPLEIKLYMRQLLLALDFLEKKKVIHRDLKPHNVLIDRSTRQLTVIDFGLAVFHTPDRDQTIAGTKVYEAPELLLSHRRYDSKADMWSFAAMLAALVFRKSPFFTGGTPERVLSTVVKVLGWEGLQSYMAVIGRAANLSDPLFSLQKHRVPLHRLVTSNHTPPYASEEVLSLLDKLLQWNPSDRLSAHEALQHPYFATA